MELERAEENGAIQGRRKTTAEIMQKNGKKCGEIVGKCGPAELCGDIMQNVNHIFLSGPSEHKSDFFLARGCCRVFGRIIFFSRT